MFRHLIRAFQQLSDPPIWRMVLLCVVLSIALIALMVMLVEVVLLNVVVTAIPWLDFMVDVLGGVATLAVMFFMFPAITAMLAGVLSDEVAEAVENRHYPKLGAAINLPWSGQVLYGLQFFLLVVTLNVLALPLIIGLPIIAYGLNGYLLGREYFESVALRRLPKEEVRQLRRVHQLKVFGAGILIAVLSTVPIVNLVAPVVGTALMVHVFQDVARLRMAPSA